MANGKSRVVGYTEAVQLIAYDVPKLEITAPAAVIVGTPVTLAARVSNGGEVLGEEQF